MRSHLLFSSLVSMMMPFCPLVSMGQEAPGLPTLDTSSKAEASQTSKVAPVASSTGGESAVDKRPALPTSLEIQKISPDEQKMGDLLSEWLRAQDKWRASFDTVKTPEERQLLAQNPPDGVKTTQQVWNLIRKNFDEPWTLVGIAWLIDNIHELDKFPPEQVKDIKRTLFDAVEHKWITHEMVRETCPALLRSSELRSLSILEKMIRVNKNPVTQGHAALAIALKMRATPGADEPKNVALRGGYIKFALMNITGPAFAEDFGGMKIEELIKDELYTLNNLTMEQKAPELKGTLLSGETFQSGQGKVALYVFMNPNIADLENIMKRATHIYNLHKDKGFQMVFIVPSDVESLKKWASENRVTIPVLPDPNWEYHKAFRITSSAQAFLLDKQGKIRFKNAPGGVMELTIKDLLDSPHPAKK